MKKWLAMHLLGQTYGEAKVSKNFLVVLLGLKCNAYATDIMLFSLSGTKDAVYKWWKNNCD